MAERVDRSGCAARRDAAARAARRSRPRLPAARGSSSGRATSADQPRTRGPRQPRNRGLAGVAGSTGARSAPGQGTAALTAGVGAAYSTHGSCLNESVTRRRFGLCVAGCRTSLGPECRAQPGTTETQSTNGAMAPGVGREPAGSDLCQRGRGRQRSLEAAAGRLAMEKGGTPAIREFGRWMYTDRGLRPTAGSEAHHGRGHRRSSRPRPPSSAMHKSSSDSSGRHSTGNTLRLRPPIMKRPSRSSRRHAPRR